MDKYIGYVHNEIRLSSSDYTSRISYVNKSLS